MSPRSDTKPLVAVTGGDQEATWGTWNDRATLVPTAYIRGIERAGGVPVLVAAGADPDTLATRVDALVLSGGADLDPHSYGSAPHPKTQAPDESRDVFERSLLESCSSRGLPVLAVCRGLQVLNVDRGGTLLQHLPDVVGHDRHLPTPGAFARHRVRIEPGSLLAKIVGHERAEVPTHHHQAIDQLGRGLVATAWADDDVVEAVEDPSSLFLIGVQWHPEVGEDRSLFDALVAAAS